VCPVAAIKFRTILGAVQIGADVEITRLLDAGLNRKSLQGAPAILGTSLDDQLGGNCKQRQPEEQPIVEPR